jgi:hypothetical protein
VTKETVGDDSEGWGSSNKAVSAAESKLSKGSVSRSEIIESADETGSNLRRDRSGKVDNIVEKPVDALDPRKGGRFFETALGESIGAKSLDTGKSVAEIG